MAINIFSKTSFSQKREKVSNLKYNTGIGGIPGSGIAAEGGTEYTILSGTTKYHVHEFYSSDTLTLKPEYTSIEDVEYLVVAGGGGGGL